MIVQMLMEYLAWMMQHTLLSFIQIPPFPETWTAAVDQFFDLLFQNVGLVNLAVPWNVVKLGIPILIAILNMDKIYDAVMWIIRKIPMLGMS